MGFRNKSTNWRVPVQTAVKVLKVHRSRDFYILSYYSFEAESTKVNGGSQTFHLSTDEFLLRTNTEVCRERCPLPFPGNEWGNGCRTTTDISD